MNLDKLQQWLQDSNNDLAYISNPITIPTSLATQWSPMKESLL